MKIGIKYCGGCNPKYNRKKLLNKIEEALSKEHDFVIADINQHYELLLVICGCTSACADYSKILADKVIILRSDKEYEKLTISL